MKHPTSILIHRVFSVTVNPIKTLKTEDGSPFDVFDIVVETETGSFVLTLFPAEEEFESNFQTEGKTYQ